MAKSICGNEVVKIHYKPAQESYDWWDQWGPGLMQGAAHSISSEEQSEDAADKVRKVAEEVSGKTFPRAVRKMGFY